MSYKFLYFCGEPMRNKYVRKRRRRL